MLKKCARITDGELVQLILQRQRPGAEALYDNYGKFLLLAICRIIPERNQAETVLEEVITKIWNTIDEYILEKEKIYTWMIAIARRTALDALTSTAVYDEKKSEGVYAFKR